MRESTIIYNGKLTQRWVFDDVEDFERNKQRLTPHLIAEYEKKFYPDGDLPSYEDTATFEEMEDGEVDLDRNWREPAPELSSSPSGGVPVATEEVYPTPSTSPEHRPQSAGSSSNSKRARGGLEALSPRNCCYDIPIFAKITCLTGLFKGTVHYHHLIPKVLQTDSAANYSLPTSTRKHIVREASTPLLSKNRIWADKNMNYVLREIHDSLSDIYDLNMIGVNNSSYWLTEWNGNVVDGNQTFGALVQEFLTSGAGRRCEPLVLQPYLGKLKPTKRDESASIGHSVTEKSPGGGRKTIGAKVYGKPRTGSSANERRERMAKSVSWEEDVNFSSRRMVGGVAPFKRPRLERV